MRSGALRELITIDRSRSLRDGFGYDKGRKKSRIKARAQIRHDRGTRIEENGEIVHSYDITFIVWIHLLPHIDENDVVEWRKRRYRIISLEPVRETMILYIKAELINE